MIDSKIVINGKPYSLVRMLKDGIPYRTASVGLYTTQSGTEVIIKQVKYRFKNMAYYKLVHESRVLQIISEARSRFRDHEICIPEHMEFNETQHEASLIREFLQGQPIRHMSSQICREAILKSLAEFSRITTMLTTSESRSLPRRTSMHMVFSILIYCLGAIVKNPSRGLMILKLMSLFYGYYVHTFFVPSVYTFAHRDLTPDNIIFYNGKFSLIDTELCMMADEESDIAVSAREFFDILGLEGTVDLILHLLPSSSQKLKFVWITSFYLVQSLARMEKQDPGYTRDATYAHAFITAIIPKLYMSGADTSVHIRAQV